MEPSRVSQSNLNCLNFQFKYNPMKEAWLVISVAYWDDQPCFLHWIRQAHSQERKVFPSHLWVLWINKASNMGSNWNIS